MQAEDVMRNNLTLYIKVFFQFIFYLIGTFLHEFAHWTFAKLTFSETPSRATIEEEDENGNKIKIEVAGFTIIPKIKKDYVVYGHVLSIPKVNASLILISAAPLLWLVALYYLLFIYGYLEFLVQDGEIYFSLNYKELFTFNNWLIIYISLQLLWAGTLSSQDVKMFFKGVFSPSFIIALFLFLSIYDFNNNFVILEYIKGLLS